MSATQFQGSFVPMLLTVVLFSALKSLKKSQNIQNKKRRLSLMNENVPPQPSLLDKYLRI